MNKWQKRALVFGSIMFFTGLFMLVSIPTFLFVSGMLVMITTAISFCDEFKT